MTAAATNGTAREGEGGRTISSIPRRAPARWLLPLLALLIIAAGCRSVSKPGGYAEPKPDGDSIYVSIHTGKMAAVTASDFSVIWEFPQSKEFACGGDKSSPHDLKALYSMPVVDSGRVYFGAYDGKVYALNAENGSCEWESHKASDSSAQCHDREPDGPIIGGMVLVDGVLYFGSDDGQLYGIEAETGAVHSCVDVKGAVWSAPLLIDKTLYVTTMSGAVWAVDAANAGDPQAKQLFKTSAALLTDPVLAGTKLLVGGIGEKLYAIDAASGQVSWEFSGGNWFWGRPEVHGDVAYVTNLDGKVYAIDVGTGKAIWQDNTFTAPEAIRAGPLLAGDVLVVADRGGNIYSLDPNTGQVLKKSEAIIEKRVLANPVALDGAVLVVAQDGSLYRVEPGGDKPPELLQVAKK